MKAAWKMAGTIEMAKRALQPPRKVMPAPKASARGQGSGRSIQFCVHLLAALIDGIYMRQFDQR